jgi:predicted DNA-binding protein YlxM (UPF0122 family)
MWWSGHKLIDSHELESRFSNEDGLSEIGITVSEEMSEETLEKLDRIRDMLDRIPPREADFIELYYFNKMRQTDIAELFCVTQPTVCYRLQRASDRLKYLMELPDINSSQLRENLTGKFKDEVDVDIMILMFETTCQSEVANSLSVSQGLVRHRFIRSMKALAHYPELDYILQMYEKLSKNLNILREVQRPTLPNEIFNVVH